MLGSGGAVAGVDCISVHRRAPPLWRWGHVLFGNIVVATIAMVEVGLERTKMSRPSLNNLEPGMVLIDDYSPLIQYQPQWFDSYNLPATRDPHVNKYNGASFHSSQTNGSTATLKFHGTAVYIYGAKRFNHGFYSVSIDGVMSDPADGYAPGQGLFQELLFSREQLTDTIHTLVLANIIRDNARPFVDIDCIVWTRSVARQEIDDKDSMFSFPGSSGTWEEFRNLNGYKNNAGHRTNVAGAQAILDFQGSDLLLYGGTGPIHGQYKVKVDNQPEVVLNSSTRNPHQPTVLYAHSNMGDGGHKLVVTNLENKVLFIDYVEVMSGGSGLSRGASAGIVVSIVAGLALIAVPVWLLFVKRRRAKRRFSTDLVGDSDDSQAAPMGWYPPGNDSMLVEPFTEEPNRINVSDMPSSSGLNGSRVGKMSAPGVYTNRNPEAGSGMSISEARTYVHVERDAGALPPGYNDIDLSRMADGSFRNAM
ncbi:unnamed protein product [Rhizoctonia solani]|uniref:Transmembrane protein n=1 Tax=Rhizoctonia solani TaxID=456999 RepID=A0A8H3CR70_9AGAM|nr:unnamed protein product [Rhizoctonia solani]